MNIDFGTFRGAVVKSKFGAKSLQVKYDAGKYGGGAGPNIGAKIPAQNEYYLAYSVLFDNNFDWGGRYEGGKLPGLAGKGYCSGGSTCNGTNGFTARYMWRDDGRVVVYLYHMNKPGTWGEDIRLKSSSGKDKYFQPGKWHRLVQRVKIKSGNNNNGEIEVWMDGERVAYRNGLRFVDNGNKVDRFYFNTFHGGSDPNWAPSSTSFAYFDDILITRDRNQALN